MHWVGVLLAILALFYCIFPASASELIFYLNNGDKQCFYEHIEADSWIRLNYYVLRGGDLRVGVTVRSPDGRALYDQPDEAFDSAALTVAQSGVHSVCFYGARAAIGGAKCVSFELDVTTPAQIVASAAAADPVDEAVLMDRLSAIGSALDSVTTVQSFLRHRASVDASRAEDVNTRVSLWSLAHSAAIVGVGAVQLLIIRRPFDVAARTRI